jgi:beta-galactosidase
VVTTAGQPYRIELVPDRTAIQADGEDLCFITVRITDNQGVVSPRADNLLKFTVEGPGMIVATDNGDPANMVPFPSHERQAFNGLCLVIVRSIPDKSGPVILHAESEMLQGARITLRSTLAKTR